MDDGLGGRLCPFTNWKPTDRPSGDVHLSFLSVSQLRSAFILRTVKRPRGAPAGDAIFFGFVLPSELQEKMRANNPFPGKLLTRSGVLCLLLMPAFASTQQPPHWSYSGKEGPSEWGKLDSLYAVCSTGQTQSPIDIRGAKKA